MWDVLMGSTVNYNNCAVRKIDCSCVRFSCIMFGYLEICNSFSSLFVQSFFGGELKLIDESFLTFLEQSGLQLHDFLHPESFIIGLFLMYMEIASIFFKISVILTLKQRKIDRISHFQTSMLANIVIKTNKSSLKCHHNQYKCPLPTRNS